MRENPLPGCARHVPARCGCPDIIASQGGTCWAWTLPTPLAHPPDERAHIAGYTKEQEAHANRLVDEVYATFLQRVADGRGMPLDAVRGVAKGRVWTGQQAYTQGLVDALGGLDDAILLAKKEAQLPLEVGPGGLVGVPLWRV